MLRVKFTASTMYTASFYFIFAVPAARGKWFLLSVSVAGPGNSAAAVHSCADLLPTVVVRISLLTVYHVCTYEPVVSSVTTATMLWTGIIRSGVAFNGSRAGDGVG